jgi:hypothetical protein
MPLPSGRYGRRAADEPNLIMLEQLVAVCHFCHQQGGLSDLEVIHQAASIATELCSASPYVW